MNPELIVSDCGLQLQQYHSVTGGDVNHAFYLRCREGVFFLKVNQAAAYPSMFRTEADGLDALRKESSFYIPQVIRTGVTNGYQYLLMQWLEPGVANGSFWEQLGHSLAAQHRRQQAFFGWHEDNYIGRLPQRNNRRDSWSEFFRQERILPLVQQLTVSGDFDFSVCRAAEQCCRQLERMIPPETPALLHGDLWSGNVMALPSGRPAVFDPAVYYGHREMDIAMTLLFGGFDQRFYNAYEELYPLEPGWRSRVELFQLYPLLVHAVLFGGHYVERSAAIIRRWAE